MRDEALELLGLVFVCLVIVPIVAALSAGVLTYVAVSLIQWLAV